MNDMNNRLAGLSPEKRALLMQQLALALGQEPAAPLDRRPERPLSFGKVDRSLHHQREPFVEGLQDVLRREDDEPGCDQLDCEREPVQTATDRLDRRQHVLVEYDASSGCELDEERRGVVDRQRI